VSETSQVIQLKPVKEKT